MQNSRANACGTARGRTTRWRRLVGLACAALLCAVALPAPAQESLDTPFGTAEPEEEGESEGDAAPTDEPTPSPDASATPNASATPGASATPDAAAQPDVGLDQLLRLPNSLDFKEERRGGGGAADWRRRFSESELSVARAEAKLEEAETAMAEAGVAGGGQWQIAPPGQQASAADTGPLSFKLREELRRAREGLEEAERRHRALIVEADLAGVPEDWRVGAR